jgi:uncharacterized membrane protein
MGFGVTVLLFVSFLSIIVFPLKEQALSKVSVNELITALSKTDIRYFYVKFYSSAPNYTITFKVRDDSCRSKKKSTHTHTHTVRPQSNVLVVMCVCYVVESISCNENKANTLRPARLAH